MASTGLAGQQTAPIAASDHSQLGSFEMLNMLNLDRNRAIAAFPFANSQISESESRSRFWSCRWMDLRICREVDHALDSALLTHLPTVDLPGVFVPPSPPPWLTFNGQLRQATALEGVLDKTRNARVSGPPRGRLLIWSQ